MCRDNSPETATATRRKDAPSNDVLAMSCMFNEVLHVLWSRLANEGLEGTCNTLRIGIARAIHCPTDRTLQVAFRWTALWICRAADSLDTSRIVEDVLPCCSVSALQSLTLGRRRAEAPTGVSCWRWAAANLKLSPQLLTLAQNSQTKPITHSPYCMV